LNPFFSRFGNMVLTDNLTGDGCFDYENTEIDRFKSIKDKVNNYFTFKSNFILIRYSLKEIKPLSYFTISGEYIWSVCTAINERKRGYMNTLFKHFIQLLKRGELNESSDIVLLNNLLHLILLKKNPSFLKTRVFYEECGFKLKDEYGDRIIMVIKI